MTLHRVEHRAADAVAIEDVGLRDRVVDHGLVVDSAAGVVPEGVADDAAGLHARAVGIPAGPVEVVRENVVDERLAEHVALEAGRPVALGRAGMVQHEDVVLGGQAAFDDEVVLQDVADPRAGCLNGATATVKVASPDDVGSPVTAHGGTVGVHEETILHHAVLAAQLYPPAVPTELDLADGPPVGRGIDGHDRRLAAVFNPPQLAGVLAIGVEPERVVRLAVSGPVDLFILGRRVLPPGEDRLAVQQEQEVIRHILRQFDLPTLTCRDRLPVAPGGQGAGHVTELHVVILPGAQNDWPVHGGLLVDDDPVRVVARLDPDRVAPWAALTAGGIVLKGRFSVPAFLSLALGCFWSTK